MILINHRVVKIMRRKFLGISLIYYNKPNHNLRKIIGTTMKKKLFKRRNKKQIKTAKKESYKRGMC